MENTGDAPEATGSDTLESLAGVFESALTQEAGDSAPKKKAAEAEAPVVESEEDPEPEDEDAEAAESDEGEDDEADQGETQEAQEQPQTFKVKVDGEEHEVTLDELTKGYSREADYTRKTQALSTEKAALQAALAADKEALKAERAEYKAVLDFYHDQIKNAFGTPEELEQLRQHNAPEYAVRVADQVRLRERMNAIEAEQRKLKEKEAGEQKKAEAEHNQREVQALLNAVPEWKDDEKRKADQVRMANYAQARALTPQDLSGIRDHRLLLVLRDAARFHELSQKKPVPVKAPQAKPVQSVKPGTVQAQPETRSRAAKAEARLKSTGHVNDLAAVFKARGIA